MMTTLGNWTSAEIATPPGGLFFHLWTWHSVTVKRTCLARRTAWTAMLVVALAIAAPRDALAYVDPGYATLLWQALVAGVLGGMFVARETIRATVRRLERWMRRPPPSGPTDEA
ncbi:MAG: hypothetical protein ACHQ9S_26345 [Candidatus Binatia bacterium]